MCLVVGISACWQEKLVQWLRCDFVLGNPIWGLLPIRLKYCQKLCVSDFQIVYPPQKKKVIESYNYSFFALSMVYIMKNGVAEKWSHETWCRASVSVRLASIWRNIYKYGQFIFCCCCMYVLRQHGRKWLFMSRISLLICQWFYDVLR